MALVRLQCKFTFGGTTSGSAGLGEGWNFWLCTVTLYLRFSDKWKKPVPTKKTTEQNAQGGTECGQFRLSSGLKKAESSQR